MKYLSLFSGIEAASVAWLPLKWEPVAFSEIDPFPCAVLAHHYPNVPNLGDMTQIDGRMYRGAVDLVIGGSPCQDMSVAGKRAGLAGKRSGLALNFINLLADVRPRWCVWENVPGAFSSNNGRDFGVLLKALDDIGYHVAWRVLDAQFWGVPQRRRRIFAIGHLRDWRYPAAVLFEPNCLHGNAAKVGKKRQTIAANPQKSIARSLSTRNQRLDCDTETFIPVEIAVPQLMRMRCGCEGGGKGVLLSEDKSLTLATSNDQVLFEPVEKQYAVRRLTPVEAERLQGFPDRYTAVPYRGKPAADGPRYKALGNSMAVPVVRWIGERIQKIEDEM